MSQWAPHPAREDAGSATDRGRWQAGRGNTEQPPRPPPASPKPPQLWVRLPWLHRLHKWPQPCGPASASSLHAESTRGPEPAQGAPRGHNGLVAPAHNPGLNRWAGRMLPTLLLGGGRGAGSPSTHISAHPAAMQKQELARKEGGETGGAPLQQKRALEANPTLQPSSAWGSCPRAEGAWAESIMRRPGRRPPSQSNALGDQRSTCWVVSWEGLGRKRLDWSGKPRAEGRAETQRG